MSALRDLKVGRLTLPATLLSARFSRSGGPGGQNVNKVASKAEIRFDLNEAEAFFDADAMVRIRNRFANRLDADGRVLIVASEHRDQARNVEAALERLEQMLRQAMVKPKTRRPTKPTKGSQRRRLDANAAAVKSFKGASSGRIERTPYSQGARRFPYNPANQIRI